MTALVYVYAILPRALEVSIEGIDAAPVRWVQADGLSAAVSEVPQDEFDEEPLNEHVRDMAWLGPRAIAHQAVNARLFEEAEAIVPLAFGTVFRNEDRVREFLHAEVSGLQERLEHVRGCAEWVVALHLLRQPKAEDIVAASPKLRALREQIAASSPGRAHLLQRRLATLQRDEERRLQADAASQLLGRLRAVAVNVFQEALPADAVERPLLRASVLVRRQAEAELLDAVDRLRRTWPEPTYRLLLTGPWPPYRFAGLQHDHE